MEYKNIIFDKKDGIGYVTMNRPKALNALNTEVLTELDDVFRAIDKDDEVRVAIVTGEDDPGTEGNGTDRKHQQACYCRSKWICIRRWK